jgi:hypothetical protein
MAEEEGQSAEEMEANLASYREQLAQVSREAFEHFCAFCFRPPQHQP